MPSRRLSMSTRLGGSSMAKRRSRTPSRQTGFSPVRRTTTIGNSVTARATFPTRSRLLDYRPRALASAFPRSGSQALRRLPDWVVRRAGSKIALIHSVTSNARARADLPSRLIRPSRVSLIHPSLAKTQTPCRRRQVRRSVMFSRDIAGRRWGAGGPKMKGAKRTFLSNYTCR